MAFVSVVSGLSCSSFDGLRTSSRSADQLRDVDGSHQRGASLESLEDVLRGGTGHHLRCGVRLRQGRPPREVCVLKGRMKTARDWRRDFFALLVAF